MIDRHFVVACHDAAEAPRPGIVLCDDEGHPIDAAVWMQAATVAAAELARPGTGLGARALNAARAVEASTGRSIGAQLAVLCAPLAMAAERKGRLHRNVLAVLAAATAEDFEQIAQVAALVPPSAFRTVLRQAIQRAAEHDGIARLYAEDFATLFLRVLPPFMRTLQRRQSKPWAIADCYLRWLSIWPDSEIVRRYGVEAGTTVQAKARDLSALMERARTREAVLPALRSWDADLRTLHLRPEASATLTTATLFAWQLRSMHERGEISEQEAEDTHMAAILRSTTKGA